MDDSKLRGVVMGSICWRTGLLFRVTLTEWRNELAETLWSVMLLWRKPNACWAVLAEAHLAGQEKWCFPLLGTCEAAPGILCLVWGFQVQERHWDNGVSPAGSPVRWLSATAHDIQRRGRENVCSSLGRGASWEIMLWSFSYLMERSREDRARLFSEVCSKSLRGNRHKLQHVPI